jgi:hypothetical protein
LQRTTRDVTVDAEAVGLRFLSRSAAANAVVTLALLFVFLAGVGFDPAVPPEYAELVQASRHPEAYRAAMLFDGLAWLAIGVTFLAFVALFYRRAPVRSLLSAACAFGMVSGSLGGFLRLNATSEMAARYATATPEQQAALVQTYLVLNQIIGSHFHIGQLLQAVAFLLIASVAFSLARFPRGLAIWLAVLGVTSGTLFVLDTVGTFLFPLLFAYIVAGIGLNVTLAWRFWRSSPEMFVA